MTLREFDDGCRGCKPAMLDVKTGEASPDDSPEMKIVLRVWRATTLVERKAWHRVTCQNSLTPQDLRFAQVFSKRVQEALAEGTQ